MNGVVVTLLDKLPDARNRKQPSLAAGNKGPNSQPLVGHDFFFFLQIVCFASLLLLWSLGLWLFLGFPGRRIKLASRNGLAWSLDKYDYDVAPRESPPRQCQS